MQHKTHILVTKTEAHAIRNAAATGIPLPWTCPKEAGLGDPVFFYDFNEGVIARGIVASKKPKPSKKWPGRYAANISQVKLLPLFVQRAFILEAMPEFAWARNPQSYRSLSDDEAAQFNRMVEQVSKPRFEIGEQDSSLWLNINIPLKSLVIHYRGGCSDERLKGRGTYKPEGRVGRDGGWLPFETYASAALYAEREWPSYPTIKRCTNCAKAVALADLEELGDEEGGRQLRLHRHIERSVRIVKRKRQAVIRATGRLECEACRFDFSRFYGPVGHEFCEVHHKVPLSDLDAKRKTKLDDLAVVCSNCHRMLHRGRPCFSVEGLRRQIAGQLTIGEPLG
jgi:5-methylcytosine-specific restriction endonuclease McrA